MALVAPVQVASPCFPLLCHQKRSAVRCRMQRAAVTDAARSVGQRSVLHFPFHGKAVLRGGFLSIQAFGFLLLPHPFGKVLSVFLCHAGQCLLLRWAVRLVARAFRVLLCGPVPSAVRFSALSCAVQCPLLCSSVHSFARTNGVAGVGCRSGNDVGMGL